MPGLRGTETRAKDTHCSVQESEKGKAGSQISPSAAGCLGLEFTQRPARTGLESHQEMQTQMSHFYTCGPRPLQSFHGSLVWHPVGWPASLWDEVLTSLENPALQTCQAFTRENWLWPPHGKPGPQAHDRKVLWCIKAHSCLDIRNIIGEGETIWKGNVNSYSLLEKQHWKQVLSEYANLFKSKLWECMVFIFFCFRRKQNNS